VHAFSGRDFGNSFHIPAGADLIVVLQWNDPFGQASDDFDLVLARPAAGGDVVLAASTDMQAGAGNPYEALRYVNGSAPVDAYLAIAEFSRVKAPSDLRLNLHVFSRVRLDLQYAVTRDSIFGHAAVEEVLSVAAAPATDPDRLEQFSGQGPASIFFPARRTRQVPRLTAIDGVETSVGQRGLFANPFRGTSAAAPHVAGCAALLLAAGASSSSAGAAMQSTAVDLLSAGFDPMSGAGRLDCAAAGRLATGRAQPPVVAHVAARFDPTGAVVVDASGEDADGDVRSASVRVLDRNGTQLASETVATTASGPTAFTLTVAVRSPLLARARMVSARAADATRLAGVETVDALACPGDGSVGDVLCSIGDLFDALVDEGGRRNQRLARVARRAARSRSRGGTAPHDRAPGARRARRSDRRRRERATRTHRRAPYEPRPLTRLFARRGRRCAATLGGQTLVRTREDFDAAVLGTAFRRVVGRDRTALALAAHRDASRVDPLRRERGAHGGGATLGERLVRGFAPAAVGVTDDLEARARVAHEDARDLPQLVLGAGLERRASRIEEDVARERHAQRLAVALDAILAREHFLHLVLLLVEVVADGGAAEAADCGADGGALPGSLTPTQNGADGGACGRAGAGAIDGTFRRPAALSPPRAPGHAKGKRDGDRDYAKSLRHRATSDAANTSRRPRKRSVRRLVLVREVRVLVVRLVLVGLGLFGHGAGRRCDAYGLTPVDVVVDAIGRLLLALFLARLFCFVLRLALQFLGSLVRAESRHSVSPSSRPESPGRSGVDELCLERPRARRTTGNLPGGFRLVHGNRWSP
jgi:hypothetical protein